MNKRTLFIIILGSSLLITSCAPKDKQARLKKLEVRRDILTEKIEQLKAEIGQTSGEESRPEALSYVQTAEVKTELFQHFIQVQGAVESDNNILIPAQTSGVVMKIHVNKGETVAKGQLLAELDGAILESSIAELENSLKLAITIFERQERLWRKNIGSEIQFLQAKNNKESLEKKLETLNEQYRLTKIYSPISGEVDDILIKEGEMAAAGRGTIRVVQLSKLKVTAWLAENYISRVKKNDIVQVQIPVLGKVFERAIDSVSQVIDPNNRTFQIQINIPSRGRDLKPNMLAVVTINDYTNPEALVVPRNIVQETDTEKFLFVAVRDNGRWVAKKRIVSTGKDYKDRVEILTGLVPGERVVTFGFQNLADSQPINADGQE